MTICNQLQTVFYWFGGCQIDVHDYNGDFKILLDTKPVKFEVMRTIKQYIMQELGIDPDDPPERLW